MGELLSYSLSVSVIILVLFPVLHQIVNRSTNFRFNRFAILCGLGLSLALPFVFKAELISFPADLTMSKVSDIQAVNSTINESETLVDNKMSNLTIASTWLQIALIIYLTGIIGLFIREIISFLRLFKIIAHSEKIKKDGYTICRTKDNLVSPFSWGNYIFLPDTELDHSGCIYIHEKAHTDKKHWIDILFADLFCILLWYNPFAWMTRKIMKLNHEFEADETVIRAGIDTYDYQRLLVVKAMRNRSFPLVNSFAADKRSFRKRVLIMSKNRSSKKPLLIAFCAIPTLTLAFVVMSMPVSSKLLSNISAYTFNSQPSSLQKPSDFATKGIAIENDVPKKGPDANKVIPSPFNDQTALADIIRLSIETIQPEKDIKVNIEIAVDEDGRVEDVFTNTPDGADIAAAIEKELNGIRFEQTTENGQPIKVHFNIPLQVKRQD